MDSELQEVYGSNFRRMCAWNVWGRLRSQTVTRISVVESHYGHSHDFGTVLLMINDINDLMLRQIYFTLLSGRFPRWSLIELHVPGDDTVQTHCTPRLKSWTFSQS
jgi:hypothetical protein